MHFSVRVTVLHLLNIPPSTRTKFPQVMARSDNVVRVALTPKHRDVPLLCQILTYNMGAPPIVTPIQVDQFCSRYTPPIKDFEMLDIQVRC